MSESKLFEHPDLNVRIKRTMRNENIQTFQDLARYTEAQLLAIPNFGYKSLRQLKSLLAIEGLCLKK